MFAKKKKEILKNLRICSAKKAKSFDEFVFLPKKKTNNNFIRNGKILWFMIFLKRKIQIILLRKTNWMDGREYLLIFKVLEILLITEWLMWVWRWVKYWQKMHIYILYKRSFEKFFSFAYQTDKKKKSPWKIIQNSLFRFHWNRYWNHLKW